MQLLFELFLNVLPIGAVRSRRVRLLSWGLFGAFLAMAVVADLRYA